jgi:hypothetical protein
VAGVDRGEVMEAFCKEIIRSIIRMNDHSNEVKQLFIL